jgi:hypothetical protein
MSRRKGEVTAAINERNFPRIVELPLPSGGFRSRSDDMLAFRRERGIEPRRVVSKKRGLEFVHEPAASATSPPGAGTTGA